VCEGGRGGTALPCRRVTVVAAGLPKCACGVHRAKGQWAGCQLAATVELRAVGAGVRAM
jgi:hypothetical protein